MADGDVSMTSDAALPVGADANGNGADGAVVAAVSPVAGATGAAAAAPLPPMERHERKTKTKAKAESAKRAVGAKRKRAAAGEKESESESDDDKKPRTKSLTSLTLAELKQLAIDKKIAVTADNPKKAHYMAALQAAGIHGEPLPPRAKGKKKKPAAAAAAAAPAAKGKAKGKKSKAKEESDDEEEDEEEEPPKKKAKAEKKAPAKAKAAPKKAKKKADSEEDDDGDDDDAPKKKGKGKAAAAAAAPKKKAAGSGEQAKWDAIYEEVSQLNGPKLKAELELNDQIKSGKVAELVERVTDGRMYGALPRCPKCHAAKLKVQYDGKKKTGHGGQGEFKCPGHMEDHFYACSYRSTHENRPPWKIGGAEEEE